MLIFILLEFGLYAILLFFSNRDWDVRTKVLFVITLICLLSFPLYQYGRANDFVMRVSIPALFAFAVLLGRTLNRKSLPVYKRIILLFLVILGAATVMIEFRCHIMHIQETGTIFNSPEISQVAGLSDRLRRPDDLIIQYIGSSQAPFFRYLVKAHNAPTPRTAA